MAQFLQRGKNLGMGLSTSTQPGELRVRDIFRPLSGAEYMFAAIDGSGGAPGTAVEIVTVLQGCGVLPEQVWQDALNRTVAANPGTRLRMAGRRHRASWRSDSPPRLRMVRNCAWDGLTEKGAEFIFATPLLIGHGPTCELIVAEAPNQRCFLVLRILHAVSDGRGMTHLLEELFRALRGEPLIGINTGASSADLLRMLQNRRKSPPTPRAASLTAFPLQAGSRALVRRITLRGPQRAILARVAVAATEYAHQHSNLPVVLSIPVDQRRHALHMTSTLLYSGMLAIDLQRGDGAEVFSLKLRQLLENQCDAIYQPGLEKLKLLPLSWLNYLVTRLPKKLWPGRVFITALISNIGRLDMAQLQCPGFHVETVYSIPVAGAGFGTPCIAVYGAHDRVEISIGFPDSAGSEKAIDDFTEFLARRLRHPLPGAAGPASVA